MVGDMDCGDHRLTGQELVLLLRNLDRHLGQRWGYGGHEETRP
jgi:hypothetical protein